MGIRYQKRVSIFPGFRLNFSASGVSATIGIPGASVTVGGRNGPAANFGIPGSGLSTRIPLRSRTDRDYGRDWQPSQPAFAPAAPAAAKSSLAPIGSSAPDALCSPHLIELRNHLMYARDQRKTAESALASNAETFETARAILAMLQQDIEALRAKQEKLRSSYLVLFRKWRLNRLDRSAESKQPAIASAIAGFKAARDAAEAARENLDGQWIDGEIELNGTAQSAWQALHQAFLSLARSNKIWDVTGERLKRPGEERSVSTSVIDRAPVALQHKKLDFFLPDTDALFWENANGDDLYFYPGFLVVFRNERDFALIDMRDLQIDFVNVSFTEQEAIPPDSRQVASTWAKANKDGSRDLRFAGNFEIPIVQYAQINLTSSTGLNEAFMFSDFEASAVFIRNYRTFVSTMSQRL